MAEVIVIARPSFIVTNQIVGPNVFFQLSMLAMKSQCNGDCAFWLMSFASFVGTEDSCGFIVAFDDVGIGGVDVDDVEIAITLSIFITTLVCDTSMILQAFQDSDLQSPTAL